MACSGVPAAMVKKRQAAATCPPSACEAAAFSVCLVYRTVKVRSVMLLEVYTLINDVP